MSRARFWSDSAFSAFSGILLACSFPWPDVSFLAWVALVPLLLVVARRPFWSGYVAGLAFFATTLYWLNIVMVTYGRLHPMLSLVAYLILVAYLSLFFAFATWLACRIRRQIELPLPLTLPIIWVALELIRSTFLTGFPWVLLGYSQHENLVLIQSADLFGVYGISGLIVLANAVIASFLHWFVDRGKRYRQGRYALVLILLLAVSIYYGHYRLQQDYSAGEQIRVAVVQGNIDQGLKWTPGQQAGTVEKYLRLSREAMLDKPALVVWPESATPFYLQDASPFQKKILDFSRATNVSLLTGSPAYENIGSGQYRYFNSAFMVSPTGTVTGRSDKIHLVPFGEYVPFGDFFPFIDKMVYGIGDFSSGEIKTLDLNGRKISVLVCYEAIFPELTRSYVRAGSELLLNITNDAWFGRSSAPYQHLAMARFRSIESRRWLIRSANTGISAFIAPSGEIVSRTDLFKDTTIAETVSFASGTTLYSRFGDVFPLLFLLISLVWLWQSRLRK